MTERRRGTWAPLLLAALAAACTVPTLKDLERERQSQCDAEHPCVGGYQCDQAAGLCRPAEGAACGPGETVACGTNVGACSEGTRSCSAADGTFGGCTGEVGPVAETCNGVDDDCDGDVDEELLGDACALSGGACAGNPACVCAGARQSCAEGTFESTCTGKSYGAAWEPEETLCDGLDNDCDGQVDEGLFQLCPKQRGVCEGTQVACAQGAYPACADAVYATHAGVAFEPYEKSCDGLDNDCDDRVDAWPPLQLSAAGASSARLVAAIPADGDGLLAYYQEGNRVRVREVRDDGTLGEPDNSTGGQDFRLPNFAPALARDGDRRYAAWVEVFGTNGYNVMLAPVNANGRSTLLEMGQPASMPVLTCLGGGVACGATPCCAGPCTGTCADVRPEALKLEVSGDRLLLTVEMSGAGGLRAIGYPADLPPLGDTLFDTLLSGAAQPAGSASLLAGSDGSFFAAFESGTAGNRVAELRRVDKTGAITTRTIPPHRWPVLASVAGASLLRLYLVEGDAVQGYDCSQGGAGCSPIGPPLLGAPPPAPAPERLAVGLPSLLAWQQGDAVFAFDLAGAQGAEPAAVAFEGGTAGQPLPVVSGARRWLGATANSTSALVQPICP